VIAIHDDFLRDPVGFRARALQQRFQTVQDGPVEFRNISPCADPTACMALVKQYPGLRPILSFFRMSPAGQIEPHTVHTDTSMAKVTAILYLNPHPPLGDGTRFLRHIGTGATMSTDDSEAPDWFDPLAWEEDGLVEARFNRLVAFDSNLFHSRAIIDNYGDDHDSSRLINVMFCDGELS
jgi:hypothetical protein